MEGKKVLITGGAGFIGSHLVERLLSEEGIGGITVLDDLSSGKKENLPDDERVKLVRGDASDPACLDEVFGHCKFSFIYHLAAKPSVQESIADPSRTHRVNFDSTLFLLEKARMVENLERFVFASSAAVYGDKPKLPCRESGDLCPISPYGIDKYTSELYVTAFNRLYGLPATVFRFFNVFGPRQDPSSPYSGVISIFMDQFRKKDPTIGIYGDGKQTRDFIFVGDIAEILVFTAKNAGTSGKTFNAGTARKTSLNDLVKTLENITGKKARINYRPARSGDIRHSASDISALRSAGFGNRFTEMKEGLKRLYEYDNASRNG